MCRFCEKPLAYVECRCTEPCGSIHCWAKPYDGSMGLDDDLRAAYGMPEFPIHLFQHCEGEA